MNVIKILVGLMVRHLDTFVHSVYQETADDA